MRVAEPEGEVQLQERDADYDERARYRHLLAQHRQQHEVLRTGVISNIGNTGNKSAHGHVARGPRVAGRASHTRR